MAVASQGRLAIATSALTTAAILLAQPSNACARGADELTAPVVFEADENCTWPTCSKHRVVCESKLVGTCLMPLPGCMANNAECVIGRCVCAEDWCSHPFGKECLPQLVYEGARPPDFERGRWLRAFTVLGSPEQFPKMWELEDKWVDLISVWCIPAVLLWLVGLLIACWTGTKLSHNLLRCLCLHRASDAANLTLVGLECRDAESPHRHKHPREPSSWPLVVSVLLIVALCAGAIWSRVENWSVSKEILKDQARRLKANALELTDETDMLNQTTSNLSKSFEDIADCEHNPVMSLVGSMAKNSTTELAEVVHQIHEHVDSIPTKADAFMDRLDSSSTTAVWGTCIPMLVLSVICLCMLAEVIGTRFFATSTTAAYEDKALAGCAVVIVLIIVFVATYSACLLSILIGLAQICEDVDNDVITYAGMQPDANLTGVEDMARFYIRGDIYNPIDAHINDAEMYVESVHDLWYEYEDLLVKPQSLTCPPLNDISIDNLQNTTYLILQKARKLINASNIYPYYHETVHDGICNHIPKSVGTYLIQLVLAGLILFPLCAVFTHSFLAHHVGAQAKSLQGAEEEESSSSSDEDALEEEGQKKRTHKNEATKTQPAGAELESKATPPLQAGSPSQGLAARDVR